MIAKSSREGNPGLRQHYEDARMNEKGLRND